MTYKTKQINRPAVNPLKNSSTIAITAYCDLDTKPERRPLWGDYWIKQRMEAEFVRQGLRIDNSRPEVLIHLFGSHMNNLPRAPVKILWIHSHPDRVGPDLLANYNIIYCISKPYIEKIRQMGFKAEWLMLPTHMKPITYEKKLHNTVFVGNNRRNGQRKLAQDLLAVKDRLGSSLSIWGNGWNSDITTSGWYRGPQYPNNKLNELYSTSKIVLNDHHHDMSREGFINPRILDALAAGAMVISDPVKNLENLVDIPTYQSPENLARLINHYLDNETLRNKIVSAARTRIKDLTYRQTIKKIIDRLKEGPLSK